MPYYYKGHLINTDYKYNAFDTTRTVRQQKRIPTHLWIEAQGNPRQETASTTWLNDNRFYTLTAVTDENTEIFLTKLVVTTLTSI